VKSAVTGPPRRDAAVLPPCALQQLALPPAELAPAPGPRLDWTCNWECMGHPDTQVAIRLHRIEEREWKALPRWRRWLTRRPAFDPLARAEGGRRA